MVSSDPLLEIAGRGKGKFVAASDRVQRMATSGSVGPVFERASKKRTEVLSRCLAELRKEINGLSAFARHLEDTLKEEAAVGDSQQRSFQQELHAEASKIAEPAIASETARVEAIRDRQQRGEYPSLLSVAEENLPSPSEIRAQYLGAAKRELECRLRSVAIDQPNRAAREEGRPLLPPLQDEPLPEHLRVSRVLLNYGRFIDLVRDHEERLAEQCSRTKAALARLRMLCEEARGEVETLSQKVAIELLKALGHHEVDTWHMGEARRRFARGEVSKVLESWNGSGKEVLITLRSVLRYHHDLIREGLSEAIVARRARAIREGSRASRGPLPGEDPR